MHSSNASPLISLAQAASQLGIHRSTAYDLVKKGTFPVKVVKVGTLLKVNRNELEAYVQGGAEIPAPAQGKG